jgi:hypothetical protein
LPIIEELKMYTCPICLTDLNAGDLQQPAGIGGGTYCPKCGERVYFSFPYGRIVAILSIVLATGTLLCLQIRSWLWLVMGTAILSIPYSLFLNAHSARFKSAVLKKWKPGPRTLFEWLYDREKPGDLFDKKR